MKRKIQILAGIALLLTGLALGAAETFLWSARADGENLAVTLSVPEGGHVGADSVAISAANGELTPVEAPAAVPHDGAYHYVRIGATALTNDCQIEFPSIASGSGFPVGFLFDPARPRRLYDLYVCMAVDPDRKWIKIGELVVIPLDRDASGDPEPVPRVKDRHDEFV